jgi:hypothetical protein
MEDGWYLVSSPIIAANWEAPSNKWAFPIGAGIGKIFKIGEQPLNFKFAGLRLREVASRWPEMGCSCPTATPFSQMTV